MSLQNANESPAQKSDFNKESENIAVMFYDKGQLKAITIVEPAMPGSALHKETRYEFAGKEITKSMNFKIAAYPLNDKTPLGIQDFEAISAKKSDIFEKTVTPDEAIKAVLASAKKYIHDQQHGFYETNNANAENAITAYENARKQKESEQKKNIVGDWIIFHNHYSAVIDPQSAATVVVVRYDLFLDLEKTSPEALKAATKIYSDQLEMQGYKVKNARLHPATSEPLPQGMTLNGTVEGRWIYNCEFSITATKGEGKEQRANALNNIARKFTPISEFDLENVIQQQKNDSTRAAPDSVSPAADKNIARPARPR